MDNKNKELFERYRRQLKLEQIGKNGQEKLLAAKVLVVGAGGLGSSALYYLAAAGVGTLGLVDSDSVDVTNLQRQILHWEKDIGRLKVHSAVEKLRKFNSTLDYHEFPCRFTLETARELIPRYDIILAAVDNIKARRIINQVCVENRRPWVEGGVDRFIGQVTVFKTPEGPCFNCLYSQSNPAAESTPLLLGTLAGVVGVLQAQEVLKLILQIGSPLIGRLLIYNSLEPSFAIVHVQADPKCPLCGGC